MRGDGGQLGLLSTAGTTPDARLDQPAAVIPVGLVPLSGTLGLEGLV
jgi:hypothetical protein